MFVPFDILFLFLWIVLIVQDEHHLHDLLLLDGNRLYLCCVGDHLKDLVLVDDLLFLLLKNTFRLATSVQDVVSLRVGADEGSVLNFGKAQAGGEADVAAEDGDKEAEDWD